MVKLQLVLSDAQLELLLRFVGEGMRGQADRREAGRKMGEELLDKIYAAMGVKL